MDCKTRELIKIGDKIKHLVRQSHAESGCVIVKMGYISLLDLLSNQYP